MGVEDTNARIMAILDAAKKLAREYHELTGKPLGVTSEVAEFEAARYLDLQLMEARTAGYDATSRRDGRTYQIKGRCVLPNSKPSQRIGKIKKDKPFDAVLLVLLDKDFNATAIFEADRVSVIAALDKPGSRARNVRGQLSVCAFKSVARQVWSLANVSKAVKT